MSLGNYEMQAVALMCIFIFVSACGPEKMPEYCSNSSVSCNSQLLLFTSLAADCVVGEKPPDCSSWEFGSASSSSLGTVRLGAYAINNLETTTNLTLHNVKWTTLRFRYERKGKNRPFCRKITVTSEQLIPELFYDCCWTDSHDHGDIILEYEVERDADRQTGKYLFMLPSHSALVDNSIPFVYMDISKSSELIARWETVGEEWFEVLVCDRDVLVERKEVVGRHGQELSYLFRQQLFPAFGEYHFKVRPLHNDTGVGDCSNSTQGWAKTPSVDVGRSMMVTVVFGIVGCMVVVALVMFILYVWNKGKPSPDARPPKALLVYTQSTASQIRVMEELAKYLKKHCFVDTMLDQLDIPETITKDPYEWYNDALAMVDFILVVASPPACCRQEGLYRDAHVVALRLLSNYLADHRFCGQCLAIVLPHASEAHLPREAHSFRRFFLPKQLDALLRVLHRDLRLPFLTLLGPPPRGGSGDFRRFGTDLREAVRLAQHAVPLPCDCSTRREWQVPLVETELSVAEPSPLVNVVQEPNNLIHFEPTVWLEDIDLMGEDRSVPQRQNLSTPTPTPMHDLSSMIL